MSEIKEDVNGVLTKVSKCLDCNKICGGCSKVAVNCTSCKSTAINGKVYNHYNDTNQFLGFCLEICPDGYKASSNVCKGIVFFGFYI